MRSFLLIAVVFSGLAVLQETAFAQGYGRYGVGYRGNAGYPIVGGYRAKLYQRGYAPYSGRYRVLLRQYAYPSAYGGLPGYGGAYGGYPGYVPYYGGPRYIGPSISIGFGFGY